MKKIGMLLLSGLCASCVTQMDPGDQTTNNDIIGGVQAASPKLDAVGTIGMKDDSGNYQFMCSATLINPTTVLTAKHCAMVTDGTLAGMKYVNLVPMFFAVGHDALHPTKLVEIIAADLSPVAEGGLVGLGNDVAIYHLISPVTDVTPITVSRAPLTVDQIGKKFAAVGYGSKDIYEDLTGDLSGLRRTGTETLRALEGKAYDLALGGWDAYLAWMITQYGSDVVTEYMDVVQEIFDTTLLLKDYEVYAGHAPGDAQTCHGDSGGPLLGKVNGEKQIFGVVSGGLSSVDLTCDYGTFYAAFGDKTQSFIAKSLTYQDPCNGRPTADVGTCEGTVATRCTTQWEGDRRLTAIDCADLDMACGRDTAGAVACVDPGAPAPAPIPNSHPAPPTATDARDMVVRAGRPLGLSRLPRR